MGEDGLLISWVWTLFFWASFLVKMVQSHGENGPGSRWSSGRTHRGFRQPVAPAAASLPFRRVVKTLRESLQRHYLRPRPGFTTCTGYTKNDGCMRLASTTSHIYSDYSVSHPVLNA